MTFLRERRAALGGSLPARRRQAESLPVPELSAFESQLDGHRRPRGLHHDGLRAGALDRCCATSSSGRHVVPIVPDESRTFGMEGMFRQLGIFSQVGQLYTPEDSEQLMFYREDKKGQVLQEGINEAGAFSSWIAAATSYSNHGVPMIPFYIFYSMFGFQRIGDLAWAAGDSRARGFLLGGTAGRTTLNGEGLQHEDGHSHLLSATIPNCVSYDPTYGYEVAVIVQEGLRRMLGRAGGRLLLPHADERELPAPGDARGRARRASCAACTRWCRPSRPRARRGCSCWARARSCARCSPAADLLRDDLGRGGRRLERHELHRAAARRDGGRALEPAASRRGAAARLGARRPWRTPTGPVVAATDYMRAFADQIRPWVHAPYRVLGTDGFGRSDYRKALRALLRGGPPPRRAGGADLAGREGAVDAAIPGKAIRAYGIDPERPAPWRV